MQRWKDGITRFLLVLLLTGVLCLPGTARGQGELPTDTATATATDTLLPTETFTLPADDPATATATETATTTETPTTSETPTVTASATLPPAPPTNAPSVDTPGDYEPDQVLVKFDRTLSAVGKAEVIEAANANVAGEIPGLGVTILHVPGGNPAEIAMQMRACPGVVYAEPNYHVYATIIPNDPGWGFQYNMNAIHAPTGWNWTTGANWVTIAIVDTGVDLTHPDLATKILPGYNVLNPSLPPQDDHRHGTHVAAIAAASSNNGVGVAGVSWGANILPVKVLNASGSGNSANVATGILWATDHGAQVINLSLGTGTPSVVLEDAVYYAYNRGVILVGATGNTGAASVLYPAAYAPVIAVGATDAMDSVAPFSNYGTAVDVVAPGATIYSANLGGGYLYLSGTSQSAPHVAGLAAILRGIPGNGPGRVRTIIETTARDIGSPGWDVYAGYGLIQVDQAILMAWPSATATATLTERPYFPPYSWKTATATATRFETSTPSLTMTFTTTHTTGETATEPSGTAGQDGGENGGVPTTASPAAGDKKELELHWGSICLGTGLIGLGVLFFWLGVGRKKRRKNSLHW